MKPAVLAVTGLLCDFMRTLPERRRCDDAKIFPANAAPAKIALIIFILETLVRYFDALLPPCFPLFSPFV